MQYRFCHIHWSKANKFLPGTMFNFSMKTYTTYTIVSRARIFWSRCILVLKQYIQPFPAKPDTICANCNCVHFCWIIQICLTTFLVLFSCNKNFHCSEAMFEASQYKTDFCLTTWPWTRTQPWALDPEVDSKESSTFLCQGTFALFSSSITSL